MWEQVKRGPSLNSLDQAEERLPLLWEVPLAYTRLQEEVMYDLEQLKKDLNEDEVWISGNSYGGLVRALVETAEAAIELNERSWSHNETPAARRLRETLNVYTK